MRISSVNVAEQALQYTRMRKRTNEQAYVYGSEGAHRSGQSRYYA